MTASIRVLICDDHVLHRAHLVRKLGLKTRAEIVRFALATGQLNGAQSAQAAS
jgi:hypothetical protein